MFSGPNILGYFSVTEKLRQWKIQAEYRLQRKPDEGAVARQSQLKGHKTSDVALTGPFELNLR